MQNLLDLLDEAAGRFGGGPFALAENGETLSFEGLARAAAGVAAGLARCGVRPGDHVALLLPNCLSFLPAYFGILRAGAMAVPVNVRLKPAELLFILTNCGARVIFVHPRTWAAAKDALSGFPDPPSLIAVEFPDDRPPGSIRLEELTRSGNPPPARPAPASDDPAAIIYTSGTTGQPKGAMLTHGAILFNIMATKAGHGLLPGDRHLLVVPLFHVTGLNTILPTALDQGAEIVISAQTDPAALITIINRFECTTFFGVPTTFYLLTSLKNLPANAAPSLRLICYSGAPMAAQTIAKLREIFPGVKLHNFFGLTETTSVSSVLPDDQALIRAESVGLPPPGVDLAIHDEADHRLPPNQVGELVIRGPSVFKGYYGRPEATSEALRDGWFHTGDAAFLDDEGYLFLRGRKKEMIIVAGENVYPIEVENALCDHPAVQEAAVYGMVDRILGEVAHAAVVLRPGETATERDLKAHLSSRLASFKQPRSIRILASLPRNPSGKVVKRELMEG
ncbi:MAG TPA: class I adenylate-forming enzyme family protein [Armatimonadota bacterium]|nr:class I adenylate-forming enzyme family protein [Armatimonadota bacterium]